MIPTQTITSPAMTTFLASSTISMWATATWGSKPALDTATPLVLPDRFGSGAKLWWGGPPGPQPTPSSARSVN